MIAVCFFASMNARLLQNFRWLSATGGSLVVCLVTPEAVYLSADSRYVHAPPDLRNSARKLIVFGPTALGGLSGLLRFTRTECDRRGNDLTRQTTFELSDVAEGLDFEGAAGDEPGLADMFTERLHLALAPIWERFTMDLDEPFGCTAAQAESKAVPSLRLAQVFYVNREPSGRAFLATISLTYSLRRSNSGHYNGVIGVPIVRRLFFSAVVQPGLYVRGARWCVRREPLRGSVDGDAGALRIIERVFERAQIATQCAAAIGGPVDVAVIDAAGRRWLKQKPECRIATDRNQRTEVPNEPIPRS
jgi:hypothetical protein